MLDVKQAVEAASQQFHSLMGQKINDIWLEEVELSDDEKFWEITLSALAPTRQTIAMPEMAALAAIFKPGIGERIYRLFEVSNETGKVKSMKARKSLA